MDGWGRLCHERAGRSPRRPVDFVEHCVAARLVSDDRAGRVRAAVACIAPRGTTAPPPDLDAAIVRAAAATSARAEAPANVAIALGAGWGRTIDPARRGSWEGVWDEALFAIADEFARSIHVTAALLTRLVPSARLDRVEQRSLADLFALQLVFGCRCGRHRRACGDATDHECCAPQHRLDHWDPSVAHLSAYVDQAVRGLAGPTIRGAAFADGMLYAELKRGNRVRRANVEAYECARCGTRADRPACPDPSCAGLAFQARRRVVLANRLVAPVTAGGDHVAVRRRLCGARGCGTLHPLSDGPTCPICGWTPAPGETAPTRQVWMRVEHTRAGRA